MSAIEILGEILGSRRLARDALESHKGTVVYTKRWWDEYPHNDQNESDRDSVTTPHNSEKLVTR